MQKLFVIYGCNGSGKSSLVKNLLLSDGENLQELSNNFGKYTISENKKYVAVGKYGIKCGGADSLKSANNYFNMIDFLIQNYPKSVVLLEGVLLTTIFNKPLKNFLRLKYDKNIDVNILLLYVTLKTAYFRVISRNGKFPKFDLIKSKQRGVLNIFSKFKQLQEFKTYIINTENKTADEVYNEFRKATIN